MKKVTITTATVGALAAVGLGLAGAAAAGSGAFGNGFGNAQDIINALQAQGYTVQLNGAAVYPLSGCTVSGVEGMDNSNISSAGALIDRTQLTTVYVDISCEEG